jgi:hypothetical protein
MKQKLDNFFKKPFWPSFLATLIFGVLLVGLMFLNKPSSSDEVFNQAIENQLSAQNIYRSRTIEEGKSSQKQVTVVNFSNKENPISHDLVEINNQSQGQDVQVITEGIGTPKADYIRYIKLDGTGSKSASSIIGKWAKNESTSTQPAQFLDNAIFGSPLMTGPLSNSTRSFIMNEVTNNEAIKIKSVDTNAQVDGKKVYKYTVDLNLKSYIPLYKKYLSELGLGKTAEKLTAPQTDSNLQMVIYIDPVTKKIIKAESPQDAEGGGEYYTNEKFIIPPAVPSKIGVSVEDLQNALSSGQ